MTSLSVVELSNSGGNCARKVSPLTRLPLWATAIASY